MLGSIKHSDSQPDLEEFTYYAGDACSSNRRFPDEMMHAGSRYENQIETFSGAQKQRIDRRYMHC
jgi:hypothetical protein